MLIDDIKNKYKTSIKINNELADLKLTLVQTLFIKQPTAESDKNAEVINTLIKHVSALQEMLVKNYFANYTLVNNEITKIKDQMQLVFQKSTFDQTLKLYAQRLIFFLNKYRNEHEEIDKIITIAENAYRKNKYQDSIDVLIDALTRIKASAKMHHISIN
jgi:septation ring formation regulator EzrA